MGSKSTRFQIIQRALTLAGRDIRLKDQAAEWLNDMIRAWAFEYKYPALRKIGDEIALPTGQYAADLPADFGAGSDNLLFGSERRPLFERDLDEFVGKGGFAAREQSGTPTAYLVDRNANQFIFNRTADRDFSFIPVYYCVPDPIPTDSSGDSQTLWMENDKLIVEGLIECIYQYTGDARELQQAQKVIALRDAYRQGAVPMGGGPDRIQLSRSRFK